MQDSHKPKYTASSQLNMEKTEPSSKRFSSQTQNLYFLSLGIALAGITFLIATAAFVVALSLNLP